MKAGENMRIEQMQYLKEIDKTHSISLAAENLYVTQSAISNAVKKLEEELGVQLLERLKHGVYLTAAGREIMAVGQHILLEMQEITEICAKHQSQADLAYEGRLSIEASPQFMMYSLPEAAADFRAQFPDVALEVYECNPAEICDSISARAFDIYLFLCIDGVEKPEKFQDIFADEGLVIQELGAYKPYVYVGESHPLAAKQAVSLEELLPYAIGVLQYEKDAPEHLLKIFGELKPARILRTNSIYLLVDQIKRGECIGIVPSVGKNLDGIQKIALRNAVRVSIYLCYAKHTANDMLVKQFLDILKKLL